MSLANRFSGLDLLDEDKAIKPNSTSIIEDKPSDEARKYQSVFSTDKKILWGDIEDDPLTFPNKNAIEGIAEKIEEQDKFEPISRKKKNAHPCSPRTKALDQELSKKSVIQISYNINSRDKDTGEFVAKTQTRDLRVVSKVLYNNISRSICKYKTHSDKGFNYREQKEKIALTNEFMQMTYKDSYSPCLFIYPVVLIHLPGGRVITRNEVRPGCRVPFSINHVVFEFHPDKSH